MFVLSYLDTAAAIISEYNGAEPLSLFLKEFFAAQKKFGSRDRRQISNLVYCFYRLGTALQGAPMQDCLLAGLFLCNQVPQPILQQLKPGWNEAIATPLVQKIALLRKEMTFDETKIFPLAQHLSPQIEKESFAFSFLEQPDTYLRLRPGKENKVLAQLKDAGYEFKIISENCIALPPAAKLDELLMLDKDAVVQDRSSQQVLSLLDNFFHKEKAFSVWDCCAASGGKSLLLHDHFPLAKLTVSDIRPSILSNLYKRFERAGIRGYQWFVGDVSHEHFGHKPMYDLVLCDAPCSGSGTWGRTPEWLRFFTEDKLRHYADLQRRIASRAAQNVKSGGFFLYITCSVYAAENEAVVQHLTQECGLNLEGQQYFKGYHQKADTLFAALLSR